MEAPNLSTFLKFVNAKKSDICVILPKIMGGHETAGGGGWSKTEGAVSPRSGPIGLYRAATG